MVCKEGFVLIKEGKAQICVPDPERYKRPDGVYEPSWAPVFYNPRMVENRDIAIAFLYWLSRSRGIRGTIVDPLAGTGVRGVRIAVEVPNVESVIINDIDPRAYEVMVKNVEINGVEHVVKVRNVDANELLFSLNREKTRMFYIDVDPFGSPAPFAYAAVSNVLRGGYIAFTATDLAPLEGKYPWKLYRRYGVIGTITDVAKEIALRNLIYFVNKVAAIVDRACIPLLSYVSQHYARVYVTVIEGAKRVENIIRNCFGVIKYCNTCGFKLVEKLFSNNTSELIRCPICGSSFIEIGPTWICKLGDEQVAMQIHDYISKELTYLDRFSDVVKLMKILSQELSIEVPRIRISSICRFLKRNMPRVESVLECLRAKGFIATRSHVAHDAIATNANYSEVIECVKCVQTS